MHSLFEIRRKIEIYIYGEQREWKNMMMINETVFFFC